MAKLREDPTGKLSVQGQAPPVSLLNNPHASISLSSRRRSSPVAPLQRFDSLNKTANFCTTTVAVISPPPTPHSPRSAHKRDTLALPLRLRSNSGLSLHTNSAAFRQYTDYSNLDGSPITPSFFNQDTTTTTFAIDSAFRPRTSGQDTPGGGEVVSSSNLYRNSKRESVASVLTSAPSRTGSCPVLCVPEFFTKDVIQIVLQSQTTFDRLMWYAEKHKSTDGMEFLAKLKEYQQSVNSVTASLSRISTENTSFAATTPLHLPSSTSRHLNADVKHITASVLPALENVFRDAKAHVEQRIIRDLYPGFVKNQLSLATEAALATANRGSFQSRFPGLAASFCLTDPLLSDNPIAFASDGFLGLSGCPREEVIGQNCRFLQGGVMQNLGVTRIRSAVSAVSAGSAGSVGSAGEGASHGAEGKVETVLNYTRDADGNLKPFWNLLFVCPLRTSTGRVAYYLNAQINISEAVGSDKEVLEILSVRPPESERLPPSTSSSSSSSPILGLGLATTAPSYTGRFNTSQESMEAAQQQQQQQQQQQPRRRSTTRGFSFMSFRKTHNSDGKGSRAQSRASTFPEQVSSSYPGPDQLHPPPASTSASSRSTTPITTASSTLDVTAATSQQPSPDHPGPYARHMVLECTTDEKASRGSSHRHQLRCAFASPGALAALGLSSVDEVRDRDVFDVLGETAIAVSKPVRRSIVSRVAGGENVSVRLRVGGGGGAFLGSAPPSAGQLSGYHGASSPDPQWSVEAALDRLTDWRHAHHSVDDVSRHGREVAFHWTPLKDATGCVRWVVLIVVPVRVRRAT
ncbi:hypothetical protein MCOR25_001518 [Pyricularia grisea]|uniref:PAS domain-containing protein n=1 Tax=Pyricularia grisea TaxID=148305 RepID=A0A6P8ANV9_PYRGI|nr:uncharacterized protein PgNI_11880 [Pyricularia grisea]KAI6380849.1 hypothetical protein MCOR25_001518 [Pyricularia grisea]TLD03717.1 hypothetical protein PgNI_11880 [Pyricularia grisea]